MENELIVIDTSVFIDYFRKTNRKDAFFEKILRFNIPLTLSVITHLEIMIGNNEKQNSFWKLLIEELPVLDYHFQINNTAANIFSDLKKRNKVIPFQDIIIAATALHYNYPLATINRKHFQYVTGLKLYTPDLFQ